MAIDLPDLTRRINAEDAIKVSATHSRSTFMNRGHNFSYFHPALTDNMDDFRKVRHDIVRDFSELLKQFG